MWFIDQRSIHHLCRCTNAQPRGASARTRTALNTHAPPSCWKLVAARALPRHTFAPRRRETAQQTRRYLAGTSGLPPMRPRSTTFGRRITRKLSWPNGQGVALLRRRLWVRVPPGATKLTLRTQALAAALRLARPRLPPRRPLRPAAVAAARPARRLRPPGPLRRPAAVAAARRLPAGSLAATLAAAGRVPRPAARLRRPPLNEFWIA